MKKQHQLGGRLLQRVAACLLVLSSSTMAVEEIFLAAHDYCRYSCPGEIKQGIYIDLLKAILEPEGYRVRLLERPWKRAIRDIQSSGL